MTAWFLHNSAKHVQELEARERVPQDILTMLTTTFWGLGGYPQIVFFYGSLEWSSHHTTGPPSILEKSDSDRVPLGLGW